MAAEQRTQKTHNHAAILRGPRRVEEHRGELVVGHVFRDRPKIAEACGLGFIAERERLQTCVDLALAEKPPARRRAADRIDNNVAALEADGSLQVLHEIGGALVQ